MSSSYAQIVFSESIFSRPKGLNSNFSGSAQRSLRNALLPKHSAEIRVALLDLFRH